MIHLANYHTLVQRELILLVDCFWNVMARAETRFCFSAKQMSPFKSAGASVQSTTGSWDVCISGCNAGYTMFRGSVADTGYPLHSSVSPSLPVCHRVPSCFNWTVFRFGMFTCCLLWLASLYIMLCTVSCLFVFNSSHPVTWTANYVKIWRDWRKFALIVVCDITGGKLIYVPYLQKALDLFARPFHLLDSYLVK
jgi:hypothetical protein